MKSIFVLFLFFSFVAANGVREDDDDSGSGIALSKDTSPVDYFDDQLIAHVGDFTVLDDPGKKRMCTCPEIARCSYKNFSNSTREECSKECASHLLHFSNDITLTECFIEGFDDEIQKGDECLEAAKEDLCAAAKSDKKILEDNLGLTNTQFDQPLDPIHNSNVLMKKAATTYSKLRTYQRCFNNCARKKEHRCREELSCSVAYPPQKELEGIYDACIGYHVVALENARRSCKCMVFKKKVVRLVDVCSLVSNVFFMNRV